MPNAMVDTKYPHSDQALRLCRVLNEPLADALPMRLWCWGIDTDREDGRFSADAKQLAQIVRFHGDPEALLRAFLECDVISSTEKNDEYRIRGWKLNAKFFRERKRLRNYTKTKNPREIHEKSTRAPRVNHDDPSSSSSSPTSPSEKWGEGTLPTSPVRTMVDAKALLVSIEHAVELFEHYQTEHARLHSSNKVLVPPSAGLESAKKILVLAGGDMALAKTVVTRFIESDHAYWHERSWALWLLENGKNFEQARLSNARRESYATQF